MIRLEPVARAGMWVAIVVAVVMALMPHPPSLPIDGYGDKFQHMLAFATIALLAGLGYRATPLWRLAEHLSFLGALIEVGQSMPILGRDCDIRDWIADTAAVLVVLGLVAAWRRRERRRAAG
jgi:VanZ family protein